MAVLSAGNIKQGQALVFPASGPPAEIPNSLLLAEKNRACLFVRDFEESASSSGLGFDEGGGERGAINRPHLYDLRFPVRSRKQKLDTEGGHRQLFFASQNDQSSLTSD